LALSLYVGLRQPPDTRPMDIVYAGLILVLFALVGLMAVGVDRL
jgi:hypothetical protein